jgi:hypothetical protein
VDALKAERIFPLEGPEVVDHTVGEGTLTASSRIHQQGRFFNHDDRMEVERNPSG